MAESTLLNPWHFSQTPPEKIETLSGFRAFLPEVSKDTPLGVGMWKVNLNRHPIHRLESLKNARLHAPLNREYYSTRSTLLPVLANQRVFSMMFAINRNRAYC